MQNDKKILGSTNVLNASTTDYTNIAALAHGIY